MADENEGTVEVEITPETTPVEPGELEQELTAEPVANDLTEPVVEEGSVEEGEVNEEASAEPEKTFTQEELDSAITKRLSRERRKQEKLEREKTLANQEPLQIDSQLDPESYDSTEEYITALAVERSDAIIAHRDQTQAASAVDEKYQDQVDKAIDKYPDYIDIAHSHAFMSPDMASVIRSSDIAVDIAYHLGNNLDEAERIFKLSPLQQVRELSRLEMKLEDKPPAVKSPSAPAPLTPVHGSATTPTIFDTTDSRSVDQLSPSEWIARDRARRGFKS